MNHNPLLILTLTCVISFFAALGLAFFPGLLPVLSALPK